VATRQVGVSKGMVLYYFRTKEHLFQVTMRWARCHESLRALLGAGR
jgi:AcrR family transcriptional regulator